MEPIYARDGVQLYHGDCEKLLLELPHFDAIVTDPPYGIGEVRGKNKSRGNLAVSKDYGNLDWDNRPLSSETMEIILHAAHYLIIFGGNYYSLPPTSCWLVWDKMNGSNDFADCELAWTNLPKAVRMLSYRWNGMLRDGYDVRVHPTQKPADVMQWCIGHLPEDVGTICDPCCGSGTTGVACIRTGKRFVGIDSHLPYLELAIERFENEFSREALFQATERQTDLFPEGGC